MDIAVLKEQAKQGADVSKQEALPLAELALEALRRAGVNAAITGDMLTTAGVTTEMDRRMIDVCGFTI